MKLKETVIALSMTTAGVFAQNKVSAQSPYPVYPADIKQVGWLTYNDNTEVFTTSTDTFVLYKYRETGTHDAKWKAQDKSSYLAEFKNQFYYNPVSDAKEAFLWNYEDYKIYDGKSPITWRKDALKK